MIKNFPFQYTILSVVLNRFVIFSVTLSHVIISTHNKGYNDTLMLMLDNLFFPIRQKACNCSFLYLLVFGN